MITYEGANIKPLIFNNKIMSIKLEYKYPGEKTSLKLIFKDSYLMLPFSLRELCKSFSVKNPKSHFPFLLDDIKYIGEYPAYDLFTKLDKAEYDLMVESHVGLWSFKEESIKYCRIDCIALF